MGSEMCIRDSSSNVTKDCLCRRVRPLLRSAHPSNSKNVSSALQNHLGSYAFSSPSLAPRYRPFVDAHCRINRCPPENQAIALLLFQDLLKNRLTTGTSALYLCPPKNASCGSHDPCHQRKHPLHNAHDAHQIEIRLHILDLWRSPRHKALSCFARVSSLRLENRPTSIARSSVKPCCFTLQHKLSF